MIGEFNPKAYYGHKLMSGFGKTQCFHLVITGISTYAYRKSAV
jgi:hypothetical protein